LKRKYLVFSTSPITFSQLQLLLLFFPATPQTPLSTQKNVNRNNHHHHCIAKKGTGSNRYLYFGFSNIFREEINENYLCNMIFNKKNSIYEKKNNSQNSCFFMLFMQTHEIGYFFSTSSSSSPLSNSSMRNENKTTLMPLKAP
jgi:hypothetical protein